MELKPSNEFIELDTLSLKGRKKQRFFYYLYSHNHKAVLKIALKLKISASEVIRYLIDFKLKEIEKELKGK